MRRNTGKQLAALTFSRNAQAGIHRLGGKLPHRSGGTLVKQTQAVTHTAVRQSSNHPCCGLIQIDVFLVGHILQPGSNVLLTDAAEGKPLAPGQDGGRHLMKLGGRQNKQQMLRRLLNDFQQRIEGGQGQHMHLIDDIHPLFYLGRRVNRIVPQVTNVIHAVIGGSIDFQHIHAGSVINGAARRTSITGIPPIGMLTVDRLGKNLRAGGLAGAPGAGKQIGMAHFTGHQLCFQCLGYRHLAGHIIKGLRAVFAV